LVIEGRRKTKAPCLQRASFRAAEGIRTLDPELGKLVLYQLSYHRMRGKLPATPVDVKDVERRCG
jgi:hypothetical protein